MPSDIIVNDLSLTYKGTVGLSTATLPDVCKTPSPGGPVPIPYPNIADQSSLQKGTTSVKAHGKMIAVKGSQYGRSNGDEAGTAGGVKSSVNMKATDWITYSFDVKMDGKNACRNTDKKFHNNQNTVDLGGNIDPDDPPEGASPKKWKECSKQHDKYTAIKYRESSHRTGEYNALKTKLQAEVRAKSKNPLAASILTATERDTFNQINAEKMVMVRELGDERKKYIDMGCDDLPWPDPKHPTPEGRRNAHYGELNAVRKRLRSMHGSIA